MRENLWIKYGMAFLLLFIGGFILLLALGDFKWSLLQSIYKGWTFMILTGCFVLAYKGNIKIRAIALGVMVMMLIIFGIDSNFSTSEMSNRILDTWFI